MIQFSVMKCIIAILGVLFSSTCLLARSVVIKSAHLSQVQLRYENTTYVFAGICDMDGSTIIVPSNCILQFKQKACLINGNLVGNNTRLSGALENKVGCLLTGTWLVPNVSDLFFNTKYLDDTQILANVSNILSPVIQNSVRISRKKYNVSITNNNRIILSLPSNTKCVNKAHVTLRGNSCTSYSLVYIANASNVSYCGGRLSGDVGHHLYEPNSTSEWGHGISIIGSCDVTIKDVEVEKCIGDGIYIGGGDELCIGSFDTASKNIIISNVNCHENRRQGLSAVSVNGLSVNSSYFINTGVQEASKPSAGIDIEPNKNQSVWNVAISGCTFKGNVGMQLLSTHYDIENEMSNIKNIKVSDCVICGDAELSGASIKLSDTYMTSLSLRGSYMPEGGVTLDRCEIDGGGVVLKFYSLVNDRTREPEYMFNNCNISCDEERSGKDVNGIISTIGYYKSVARIIFNNCSVSIGEHDAQKSLVGDMNNQTIHFYNCKIKKAGSYELLNTIIQK